MADRTQSVAPWRIFDEIPVMDVLSDILDALRLRGTLYFSTEFAAPWGIRIPSFERVARFHLLVRGSCWVRVPGETGAERLEAGDLVLVPHGAEHLLSDAPERPCRHLVDVVEETGFTGEGALLYGGDDGGAPTRMVCGHFAFDQGFDHLLLAQLPAALVVRWEEAVRSSPLEQALQFIAREVHEGKPGHEAVTRRMSEILFVQAVRFWTESTEHPTGLMAALADPGLGRALAAMHAEPAEGWTLDDLARKAAMSRTLFAERFRDIVGQTPYSYLTDWRMQNARRLLATSSLSLQQIASRVGYDSAASFSRAFKKAIGSPPGAYRRAAQAES